MPIVYAEIPEFYDCPNILEIEENGNPIFCGKKVNVLKAVCEECGCTICRQTVNECYCNVCENCEENITPDNECACNRYCRRCENNLIRRSNGDILCPNCDI